MFTLLLLCPCSPSSPSSPDSEREARPDPCVPFRARGIQAFHLAQLASGSGMPDAAHLRPMPFLLYLADGESEPGAYNVFAMNKLQPLQKE